VLEVSQIVGKSQDAVKKLQARGLQALKTILSTSPQPAAMA
jgi:DNA-directed RNA polymerase specialized sigma24 family protein